jgi:uncharacterized membrane protein
MEKTKTNLAARLRNYFLAGIVVTGPIGLTFYLTYLFLNSVDTGVISLVPDRYNLFHTVPGLGIVAALAFFVLVGWFATNFLGKFFIGLSERIVEKMPIVRTIYSTFKQLFESIISPKSQTFREVVMLEYPRTGIWSIGLVTGEAKGAVAKVAGDEAISVYLPSALNMASGFLVYVSKKDLHYIDMSVEEAMKLVVSAGIVSGEVKKA